MFNLSTDFIIKGKITKDIKEEFLKKYFEVFWEEQSQKPDFTIRIFTYCKRKISKQKNNDKFLGYSCYELVSLPKEKKKLFLQEYKKLGWEGFNVKEEDIPDYTLFSKPMGEILEVLKIPKTSFRHTREMILNFLCFLNDLNLVVFPLSLTQYPPINFTGKMKVMEKELEQEFLEEYLFVHKTPNNQIGHMLRSYTGSLYDFNKNNYLKTVKFLNEEVPSDVKRNLYSNFLDTIYYVACRTRKNLDPDFAINRYVAAGKWFSFKFLDLFEGMNVYKNDFELYLTNYEMDPTRAKTGLRYLVKYIISLKHKPQWKDFNRTENIFDPKRKFQTLTSFLEKENASSNVWNIVIGELYKFFDHLRQKGKITLNPIFPKEDYKNNKVKSKNGTHRKSINEELILEAKKILTENNFHFPKNCAGAYNYIKEIYNHKSGQMDTDIWCPSTAIALYTLLEVPIRGIQVQLLDSGEGDENRYSFKEKRMIKNNHNLAEKGRCEGFVRKSGYEEFDGEFYSLWITTNKSITDGYEIPYLSEEFYKILTVQYDFLEKYDPNPIKTHKGEFHRTSLVKKYPMFYPLFRDLTSKTQTVIAKKKIETLWGQVCLELERRYREKGITLSITEQQRINNESYRVKSKYDIHTLRVTGITNLLDKGVPLNLVSRYFAGHSSFAMTLWYNSPRPQKLREHLEKAKNNAIKNGEWNYAGETPELVQENFIGTNQNLVGENKGFLSVGISGICPYKKCEEGGEFDGKLNKHKPVPVGTNGPNCFQCRFFITGPKFLTGQMIEGNILIRNIQKKVQFIDELKEKIMDAEDEKNLNKANVLKGQKRIEEESYKNMLHEWWSRIKTFEASKKMMSKNEKSLVVNGDEATPIIKEMGEFELLHNITTFGEFFPEFMNFKEPFMELENVLGKFLMKNNVSPFILSLDNKEKVKACNLMGELLIGMSNHYDINELLDGKVLLKDIPQLQGKIDKLLDYKGG